MTDNKELTFELKISPETHEKLLSALYKIEDNIAFFGKKTEQYKEIRNVIKQLSKQK